MILKLEENGIVFIVAPEFLLMRPRQLIKPPNGGDNIKGDNLNTPPVQLLRVEVVNE